MNIRNPVRAVLAASAVALIGLGAASAGPNAPGSNSGGNTTFYVFWNGGCTEGDTTCKVTVTAQSTLKGQSPDETCTKPVDSNHCTGSTYYRYERQYVGAPWYFAGSK